MIEPSDELRALIEHERSELPPDALIEQGWARLETAVATGLPPDPGTGLEGGAETLASTKLASTTSLKLVATVTAVVAGGVATWALTRDTDEPAQPLPAAVQTTNAEPLSPAPPPDRPAIEPDEPSPLGDEELGPAPAGDAPRPTRPRAEPKPQEGSDRLAAELALVDAARRALAEGEAARALELARRHARLHQAGVLAEEREAIEAVALCELGRSRARAVADRFLREHPRSTHIDRVRAACIRAPELPSNDEESR